MDDDTHRSLDELRAPRPTSLVAEMLEIQKRATRLPRDFAWTEDLKCLSICSGKRYDLDLCQPAKALFRDVLPRHSREYVAVSYPCTPSQYESGKTGGYKIVDHVGNVQEAKVRDGVLDRATRYARSRKVSTIWIDQECIDQEDANAKKAAMRSMDMVYRRSRYPVGLLSTPLRHQHELDLLLLLLQGKLTVGHERSRRPQLAYEVGAETAREVLKVLFSIMRDPWWQRRWISTLR